jgi:hypothetical protein
MVYAGGAEGEQREGGCRLGMTRKDRGKSHTFCELFAMLRAADSGAFRHSFFVMSTRITGGPNE